MRRFSEAFKRPAALWITAFVLCALVALWALLRSDFHRAFNYMNALTAAGGVCIFAGLLMLVSFYGAFDFFGYAFMSRVKRKQTDYRSYQDEKKAARNRFRFLPFLITGAVFIAAGIAVTLVV